MTHIGLAGSFGALLVGDYGARAVSRKTPIYFIIIISGSIIRISIRISCIREFLISNSSLNLFFKDTDQHMLSHIDDDEKNERKYVGAEYHPRVFKAADIAVENLIMNGIIKAMMNLMS